MPLLLAFSFLNLSGEDALKEVICCLLAWKLFDKLFFHEFDHFCLGLDDLINVFYVYYEEFGVVRFTCHGVMHVYWHGEICLGKID